MPSVKNTERQFLTKLISDVQQGKYKNGQDYMQKVLEYKLKNRVKKQFEKDLYK